MNSEQVNYPIPFHELGFSQIWNVFFNFACQDDLDESALPSFTFKNDAMCLFV